MNTGMAKACLLLPVLLVTARISLSQQSQTSSPTYTLRGSVVNSVTNQPIHKAEVEVNGSQARSVSTGSDGQFEVTGLPGGPYTVTAHRPGFSDPYLLKQHIETVSLGPDTSPVTIKLEPLSEIAGRVLDGDGDAVPNLHVRSFRLSVESGHKRWQPGTFAGTDDAGNFLIDGLQPGKYILETTEQQVYPGLIADDQASRLIYLRQFFPNAPDLSSAQLVEVGGGGTTQCDFTLAVVRGTRVFFSVVPEQPWVNVKLEGESGDEFNAQVRHNIRTSGWILPSIPPGSWRLQVSANSGDGELWGEVPINVGAADLRNVTVGLSLRSQVPVTFTGAPSSGPPAGPVQLFPLSEALDSSRFVGMAAKRDETDTQLLLSGMLPGRYHALAGLSDSYCVETITSGLADLARTDYVIPESGTPQPINVGLGSNCASLHISGTQFPGGLFSAVITGGAYSLEPVVLFGPNSVFKLAPGEYDVYAIPNGNLIEYANPEVLKKYPVHHVSLSPNQSLTLEMVLPEEETTR